MRRHGEAEEAAAVARVDRGPVHVQAEAGHRDGEQQAAGQPRHGGHGHVSRVSLGASGPHPAAVRCSVSDKSVAAAAMASVDTGRRSWGGLLVRESAQGKASARHTWPGGSSVLSSPASLPALSHASKNIFSISNNKNLNLRHGAMVCTVYANV